MKCICPPEIANALECRCGAFYRDSRPPKEENITDLKLDLLDQLDQVRYLIEGYVDVVDGDYGIPKANKATEAVQILDSLIAKLEPKP